MTAQTCEYIEDNGECCAAPATTHFLFRPLRPGATWTASLACKDHLYPGRISAVDEHPVGPICAAPNCRWIDRLPRGTSFCVDPDEETALHESLHQRTPQEATA